MSLSLRVLQTPVNLGGSSNSIKQASGLQVSNIFQESAYAADASNRLATVSSRRSFQSQGGQSSKREGETSKKLLRQPKVEQKIKMILVEDREVPAFVSSLNSVQRDKEEYNQWKEATMAIERS